MSFMEDRLTLMGNYTQQTWNKKLCWEAKDTLFACVDRQENGNKFRCPDELYAYEMWCPTEVRRLQSAKRRQEDREASIFNAETLYKMNLEKQTIQ